MSRKSFENNPVGFLKKFISRSNSLLATAEGLGFPNLSLFTTLSECSDSELLQLTLAYRDRLLDLQHWLVLVYAKDGRQEVFELIDSVQHLAECYRIKRF